MCAGRHPRVSEGVARTRVLNGRVDSPLALQLEDQVKALKVDIEPVVGLRLDILLKRRVEHGQVQREISALRYAAILDASMRVHVAPWQLGCFELRR